MININSLTYTIESGKILNKLNASIHEGEITGLIGRSGSGKSVLLKIISGNIKNYAGDISLDDISLKKFKKKELEKQIAFASDAVPKDIIDDTVFNFLLQSRKPFKKKLNPFSGYDLQIVDENIKLFGLEKYGDERVFSLSDGIRKKVFLAFSFARDAGIMLFDNPTNFLDLHSIELLQRAIIKNALNGDKIIIIAANELNFILQTCDKILLLDSGTVVKEIIPSETDSQLINDYFSTDVLMSKNIYNGRPAINQYLKL